MLFLPEKFTLLGSVQVVLKSLFLLLLQWNLNVLAVLRQFLEVLVVVQVGLGVSLVLWKVPVLPAGTHQGVGLLLWAVLVYLCRNAVSADTAGDAAGDAAGPRGQAA